MDKDSRCPGCGQPFHETLGDENYDRWNARMVTCDACRATSRAAHMAAGRDELDPLAGARFSVWSDPNGSSPAPHVHPR